MLLPFIRKVIKSQLNIIEAFHYQPPQESVKKDKYVMQFMDKLLSLFIVLIMDS